MYWVNGGWDRFVLLIPLCGVYVDEFLAQAFQAITYWVRARKDEMGRLSRFDDNGWMLVGGNPK
jgi:hypothetical protein